MLPSRPQSGIMILNFFFYSNVISGIKKFFFRFPDYLKYHIRVLDLNQKPSRSQSGTMVLKKFFLYTHII